MKPLSEQTFYEILEVREDAGSPEIESAYARAKELYGPGSLATYSLVAPEEAALLATRIEEARRILLDPDARARYDAGLAASAEAAEAAVRIAATGVGAVAAGPQRPWVAPPSAMAPPARPAEIAGAEPRREEPPAPTRGRDEAAREEPLASEAEPAAATRPVEAAGEPVAAAPVEGTEEAGATPPIEACEEAEAAAAPEARPEPAPAPPAPLRPILLQKEVGAVAPRALPVPDGAVWSGEALRKVRESRGLSTREVCDRTKVTRYHLENIEGDRFALLPAPVYLRGILIAVARELRLDGQKVARSYLEHMAGDGDPSKVR